jgi:hypothetical protein
LNVNLELVERFALRLSCRSPLSATDAPVTCSFADAFDFRGEERCGKDAAVYFSLKKICVRH